MQRMVDLPLAAPDPQLTGARPLRLLILCAAALGLTHVDAQSGRYALAKGEVRFSHGGTRADARALVDMLLNMGIVRPSDDNDDWDWRLEVTREAGRRVVHLTPPSGWAREPDNLYYRDRGCVDTLGILSREAFAGGPLDLWCHDRTGAVETVVPWEHRKQRVKLYLGFPSVEYELGGQASEAREIGTAIDRLAILDPRRENRLTVKRHGATHVVQLTVDVTLMRSEPRDALERELRTRLHALAGAWSEAVFGGEPVDIWLVYQTDDHLGIDSFEVLGWATRPR